MQILRKVWSKYFGCEWSLGLLLIMIFGVARFVLVMDSHQNGGMSYIFIFVAMVALTLLLFNKEGYRTIGIKKPNKWHRLAISFVLGVLFSIALGFIFVWAFGKGIDNAYSYIGRIDKAPTDSIESYRLTFFLIMAFSGMMFSPIGEEFFYRGTVHQCFVPQVGETKASYIDSMAFALTHVVHFGLVFLGTQWQFLPLPALLWVMSMFLLCQLFFRCKVWADSIWAAVTCHAGFNVGMGYVIAYHLI